MGIKIPSGKSDSFSSAAGGSQPTTDNQAMLNTLANGPSQPQMSQSNSSQPTATSNPNNNFMMQALSGPDSKGYMPNDPTNLGVPLYNSDVSQPATIVALNGFNQQPYPTAVGGGAVR